MYYFDRFFYDFKKIIYKNRNRKMGAIEIILLSISSILAITAVIIFELKGLKFITINTSLFTAILISLIAIAISIYAFLLFEISKGNKNFNFIKFHKEHVIDKLIELLETDEYCFYNTQKIEWLIGCCNKKLTEKTIFDDIISCLKYFVSLLFPLFTLALGIIVERFSNEELGYYIAILILGFIILLAFILFLVPLAKQLSFPNKNCLEYLQTELEYIKADLIQDKNAQNRRNCRRYCRKRC